MFHADGGSAVLPHAERDAVNRVWTEQAVPTEELTAFTDVGQHVCFDRLAVEWMFVGECRVREPVTFSTCRVLGNGEQHLELSGDSELQPPSPSD